MLLYCLLGHRTPPATLCAFSCKPSRICIIGKQCGARRGTRKCDLGKAAAAVNEE